MASGTFRTRNAVGHATGTITERFPGQRPTLDTLHDRSPRPSSPPVRRAIFTSSATAQTSSAETEKEVVRKLSRRERNAKIAKLDVRHQEFVEYVQPIMRSLGCRADHRDR